MKTTCPHCDRRGEMPDVAIGTRVKCGSCGNSFQVEADIDVDEILIQELRPPEKTPAVSVPVKREWGRLPPDRSGFLRLAKVIIWIGWFCIIAAPVDEYASYRSSRDVIDQANVSQRRLDESLAAFRGGPEIETRNELQQRDAVREKDYKHAVTLSKLAAVLAMAFQIFSGLMLVFLGTGGKILIEVERRICETPSR